jgi:hypothetical protein
MHCSAFLRPSPDALLCSVLLDRQLPPFLRGKRARPHGSAAGGRQHLPAAGRLSRRGWAAASCSSPTHSAADRQQHLWVAGQNTSAQVSPMDLTFFCPDHSYGTHHKRFGMIRTPTLFWHRACSALALKQHLNNTLFTWQSFCLLECHRMCFLSNYEKKHATFRTHQYGLNRVQCCNIRVWSLKCNRLNIFQNQKLNNKFIC